MIESDHDALSELPVYETANRRRGAPLAMLMMVAAAWLTGRAVLWEDPFPGETILDRASTLLAQESSPAKVPSRAFNTWRTDEFAEPVTWEDFNHASRANAGSAEGLASADTTAFGRAGRPPHMGSEHYTLWRAALTGDLRNVGYGAGRGDFAGAYDGEGGPPVSPVSPPFVTGFKDKPADEKSSRWSLDAWAFWREGSNAAPISQGRVPVYGANQAGAIVQYRFAPGSKRDARAYVRAYRALVDRPESEVAAGVSAKPLQSVPVRVAGEVRVTDNRFDTRVRPAAYAVTEIPPVELPLDLRAEVYAGAGYVAGEGDTLFADGQASITRQVVRFGPENRDAVRVSVGAGAWGGAQRDAERLDVGPTMRVDLSVGDIPARFSIDWRERVGGDASPISGLAATLSTSF